MVKAKNLISSFPRYLFIFILSFLYFESLNAAKSGKGKGVAVAFGGDGAASTNSRRQGGDRATAGTNTPRSVGPAADTSSSPHGGVGANETLDAAEPAALRVLFLAAFARRASSSSQSSDRPFTLGDTLAKIIENICWALPGAVVIERRSADHRDPSQHPLLPDAGTQQAVLKRVIDDFPIFHKYEMELLGNMATTDVDGRDLRFALTLPQQLLQDGCYAVFPDYPLSPANPRLPNPPAIIAPPPPVAAGEPSHRHQQQQQEFVSLSDIFADDDGYGDSNMHPIDLTAPDDPAGPVSIYDYDLPHSLSRSGSTTDLASTSTVAVSRISATRPPNHSAGRHPQTSSTDTHLPDLNAPTDNMDGNNLPVVNDDAAAIAAAAAAYAAANRMNAQATATPPSRYLLRSRSTLSTANSAAGNNNKGGKRAKDRS